MLLYLTILVHVTLSLSKLFAIATSETAALSIEFPFASEDVSKLSQRQSLSRLSGSERQSSGGVSLDPCETQEDCVGPRSCLIFATREDCVGEVEDENGCRCVPRRFSYCANNEPCADGEVCAAFDRSFPVCISEFVVDASDGLLRVTEPFGTGLTLEQCESASDCQGDRKCAEALQNDFNACAGRGTPCVCINTITECQKSDECQLGEVCGDYRDGSTFCMSPLYIGKDNQTTIARGEGLTMEPCESDVECKRPRTCKTEGETCVLTDGDCVCEPQDGKEKCSNSSTCDEGEICANKVGESPICVSRTWVDRKDLWTAFPKESKEAKAEITTVVIPGHLCIGAHLLRHLSRDELVFATDEVAEVLCDMQHSCATPGHMVVWRGMAMMMARYCDEANCVKQAMKVNSPRYRRGAVVESRTEGLVFSVLAARYGTRAEEMVLGAAIRIGL